MARVDTKKAGKQYRCGRCTMTILKGEEYRSATPGFRSRTRLIRCLKPECRFRQSELTTSKMSQVYAAVESAEEEISAWNGEESSDLSSIMESCASEVRMVAEEYATAADAMPGAGEAMQTKADGLEAWADELEGVDFEDKPEAPEPCAHDGDNKEHPASESSKYCGDDCKKCDEAPPRDGHACAGLCKPPAEGMPEADGLEDWAESCRTACTDLLGNIPEE